MTQTRYVGEGGPEIVVPLAQGGVIRTAKPSRFCYRTVEFRAEQSDGRTLEGYAAVFNSVTRIDSWEGAFDEQIARGAFTRTINTGRMPVLQFDHGRDARTGSVPIGAIQELREDDRGLYVRATLFDNAVVEPIRQAIAGRAINGMSFRFRANQDTWTSAAARGPGFDVDLRTVREAEVPELGPVVFPAYENTVVGVRSVLAGLADDERAAFITELVAHLRAAEPALVGTSEVSPVEPAPSGTSGLTPSQRRERLYPFLKGTP